MCQRGVMIPFGNVKRPLQATMEPSDRSSWPLFLGPIRLVVTVFPQAKSYPTHDIFNHASECSLQFGGRGHCSSTFS